MAFTPFCASVLLLLFTLFFDLRAGRLLRRESHSRASKAVLTYWPLQVLIHVVVLYVVASTPVKQKSLGQVRLSFRAAPGPFAPALPPLSVEWKKQRVEHL